MITTAYQLPRPVLITVLEYLSNDSERQNEIINAVKDKIVEASSAFFILTGKATALTLKPFSFHLVITSSTGHTYTALLIDLFKAVSRLKLKDLEMVRQVLDDLNFFALDPNFARGVDPEVLHKKTHQLLDLACEQNKLEQAKTRKLLNLQISFYYRIQHLIEHLILFIEKGRELNLYKKCVNLEVFERKFETVEGKAFLKRWIRFNHSTQFPITQNFNEFQMGDFKKKYLNSSNKEVQTLAEEAIKLKKLNNLKREYNAALYDMSLISMPLFDNLKNFEKAAQDLGFKGFPQFINNIQPFFEIINRECLEVLREKGVQGLRDCERVEKSQEAFIQFANAIKPGLEFLPTLRCLYFLIYEVIGKKEIKDVLFPGKLPQPSLRHTCTYDHQSYFDLVEDSEEIEEKQQKIIPASEPMPAKAPSASTATVTEPKPVAKASKEKAKPKMLYEARVLDWFGKLGKDSWLEAPLKVQVHTFSPLVDQFVGTEYSIQDTWINTKTKHADIRFRLLGELMILNDVRWVVFRYTKGADGIWYHRDMTFQVEAKFWHLIDFPKLKARASKPKTKELHSLKHTATLEEEASTILIDCQSYKIRLYPVN